jgi:hypothetical protein
VAVAVAGSLQAADRWENGSFCNDDTPGDTCNELVHGTVQLGHDLDGSPDRDHYVLQARARHSYEARVRSNTLLFDGPGCASGCSRIDRVDAGGAIVTAGVSAGAGIGELSLHAGVAAVRWQATVTEKQYLRVVGLAGTPGTAADQYDIELLDTTVFLPRFNNTASQVTVLLIQNTSGEAVSGDIRFQDAAGAIVHTVPLSVAAHGLQVFSTASAAALSGLSGSVSIAHTGGYGALAGKGVALEPATGFTFDTPLVLMPR